MRFLSLAATAFLAATRVVAQSVPFTYDAPLDSVTATSGTTFNTGGTLVVYGVTITIPANLLIQFPATFVSWKNFTADFTAAKYAGFEIHVDGNYVKGVPIAGKVSISQLLLGTGQGTIQSVGTDGTMKIVGGPTLRINTPNGVYGTAYTARPFFTADEQNPSICGFSGYPMCIPKGATDTDCPATNRDPANRVYTPKDPTKFAPFLAGDYVTWAGVKNGANEVLVYSLVAENVQQLTSANAGQPLYVRVEDAIIGVNDGAATNVEIGTTRFTGYLSDGSGSVSVYRVDVDPCTGAETETQVAAGTLKAGDVRNKFDIRFTDGQRTVSAQQYRVKANKGSATVAKGIQAGQFTLPISSVIWPEVNIPGSAIPELPFGVFDDLKDGFVLDNQQWGQLNPWPGASAPTPVKKCTGTELNAAPPPPSGQTPVANAGPAITGQTFGAITTITGSNTNTKLTNAQLTFTWSGPAGVTINNADQPVMNFVNPWGTVSVKRTFTLKICVTGNTALCSTATVDVTTDKQVDTIKITSYQFANKGGGTLTVTAVSNNVLPSSPDGAKLQIELGGGTGFVAMSQDGTSGGSYSFSRTGIKQPAQISVKSQHNPTAVTTSALIKKRGLSRVTRFMRD